MMFFLFLEKMFYLVFYIIGSECNLDSGINYGFFAEFGVYFGDSVLVYLVEFGVNFVFIVYNVFF